MSTERSYVGRGTNAIKPTRTAKKAIKTPSLPDVVTQLKELLAGENNTTVILLVIDQSKTVNKKYRVTQMGNGNAVDSCDIMTRIKETTINQAGTGNSNIAGSEGASVTVNRLPLQ